MLKSLVGSIVILFLSPLIVAKNGTSAPFTSPILKATLLVTSVSSASSIFLNLPLVPITKLVLIAISTAPFAGLYSTAGEVYKAGPFISSKK